MLFSTGTAAKLSETTTEAEKTQPGPRTASSCTGISQKAKLPPCFAMFLTERGAGVRDKVLTMEEF